MYYECNTTKELAEKLELNIKNYTKYIKRHCGYLQLDYDRLKSGTGLTKKEEDIFIKHYHASKNVTELVNYLGWNKNTGHNRVKRVCGILGLDYDQLKGTKSNRIDISQMKEEFLSAVKNSKSIADTLRKLNKVARGGNYRTVKKYLKIYNVDTSHWKGRGWSKNEQLKDWENYKAPSSIRINLIKVRGNKCQCCGRKKWLGRDIKIEMHHEDGDVTNNNVENLTLLCPNCHSYTENWKGSNI